MVLAVQDRESQNKKRYPFELMVGGTALTFSCASQTIREEWTESFYYLNRLSTNSPPPPVDELYSVTLESNTSSMEVGVNGPCLLRIFDGTIVLYERGSLNKLHQWIHIKGLSLNGDELLLQAYRPGSDMLMDFKFTVDSWTGDQVLNKWSMAIFPPSRLEQVYVGGGGKERVTKSHSLSRTLRNSMKQNKVHSVKDEKVIRRARSFTDKSLNSIRRSMSPEASLTSNSNRHSSTSQESYSINIVNQEPDDDKAPPIPPRAPRRPKSLGLDSIDHGSGDPDYSTIRDDVSSVDKELDDLMRDIEEDNRRKRQANKSKTLGSMELLKNFEEQKRLEFIEAYGDTKQASDYMEPVPSQSVTQSLTLSNTDSIVKRHSSIEMSPSRSSKDHDYSTIPDKPNTSGRSLSANIDLSVESSLKFMTGTPPSPPLPPRPAYLSSPLSPVKTISSDVNSDISPYASTRNFNIVRGTNDEPMPPPLPPRSPVKMSRASVPAIQPLHRCPRCNGMKQHNQLTKSYSSLDQPHQHHNHHHHHHSISYDVDSTSDSDTSLKMSNESVGIMPRPNSTSPPPYLLLKENSETDKETDKDLELESVFQILDGCVKDLQNFENNISSSKDQSKQPLSKKPIHTELDEAVYRAKQAELAFTKNTTSNPVMRTMTLNRYSPSSSPKMSRGSSQKAPPTVPPRSQISLVSGRVKNGSPTESPHRQLQRYSSQRFSDGLNSTCTVFVQHISQNN